MSMKKILFIIAVAVFVTSCASDPTYTVIHETTESKITRHIESKIVAERYARPDTNTVYSIITCRYGNGNVDTVYIYETE